MHNVFDMTPMSQAANIFFVALIFIFVGLGSVFSWLYYSSRQVSVAISDTELSLNAPFYGRSISLSEIDIAAAKVVNLKDEPDLSPRFRSNGVGLPGFSLGWFKLRNGRKALLAVTSKQQVVFLPTSAGYDVMFSLRQADQFLTLLNN